MIGLLFGSVLFVECEIAIGRIQSCSATTYTGTAVVEIDGRFRACKISNGRAFECGGWFSGEAPAIGADGRWHSCPISTGKILGCEAVGFNGSVVMRRTK